MSASIEAAKPKHFAELQTFYQSCGYMGRISPNDVVFAARENGAVVGTVRLVEESGVLVLRGMYVASNRQHRGIGRRLLAAIERAIGGRECFCIPFSHLENFYGKIGFVKIKESRAPIHLQARLKEYRALSKKIIILRRSPLRLIPADSSHARLWRRWRNETAARRHNPFKLSSIKDLAERLARSGSDLRKDQFNEYRWMIEADGELIGTVALNGVNRQMGYGEIGYMLSD